MPQRHSHCSYCGQPFPADLPWPRLCAGCGQISYVNPLPVAVALQPVDGGLVAVRRAIPPGQGKLALPGGFIDVGESWQQAAVRELFEETGVRADAGRVSLFDAVSAPDGTLLVFGLLPAVRSADLPAFVPNAEAGNREILDGPAELAFPLHTQVVSSYFTQR